ncbi:Gfo/Idh/MocA family protein [Fimbriimonas ginsengisoli]|uniref:Putative GFO/IDH/MocA family oxidoreductase n=1 Tax=Fimbriimonas ginsengisoli Gsoil 348 TaxID=661478 RepID=A0A068NUG5_FIMGI|nr:Gfo/Idh/MocA family oxidoreductase [Fimbriimonas ginsengisoli]AIE86420.1 putative GFO/IDH/MocA family oxidoreductase [Fimbriimonas ginsengisoli Gsoil 348]
MTQRTFRFGIIGCGLMGREFASAAARWCHLLDLDVRPEIVAVCDANPDAMGWFTANVPSVRMATTSYAELLADPEVEAVYCAVPHNLHERLYVDIVRAGKHLFAEKPFGIDLRACQSILAAMRENPEVFVRCSSEFPYYPGAQRIARMIEQEAFGQIIEVRAGFLHSSDLDPNKPINWKRRIATCGEYGCMGDLGMHVLHMPLRAGWRPKNVRALLSKVVERRPDGHGGMAPCETWDNAILACESVQGFPLVLETKRISPGDTNTWYLRVVGTENSAEFTTHRPKTIRTLPYKSGGHQAWQEEDLGYEGVFKGITGHIFEFGFADAIQHMWASFLQELSGGVPRYGCATPEEALGSHRLFTAALESQRTDATVALE